MRSTAIVVLALLVAEAGWAKPSRDPRAEQLTEEAEKLSEAGDHEAAINAYKTAYNQSKEPKLLLRIAEEQKVAGLEIESIPVYERYLKHPRASAVEKRKITLHLADLYARISSLRIEVNRPAFVSIDGKVVGEGLLVATKKVLSGEHTVLARREGFADATVKVVVQPGEDAVARLTMTPLRKGGSSASTGTPLGSPVVPGIDPPVVTPGQSETVPVAVSARRGADTPGFLAASLRLETNLSPLEGGPSLGASAAVWRLLEVDALLLLQRAKGLRLSGTWLFRPGKVVRPLARLGMSVFFDDGATPGVQLAGGALWQARRRYGLTADLAVERYFGAPGDIKGTALILSFGARAEVF